jgi:DHA1 family multidrug resistance protein-like MFS transporter
VSQDKGKSAVAILFASLVTVMLGFGIVIPLLPFYVSHFGASGSTMGLLMSIYSIMQFIFAPFWGRLSDRVGRKPVLLIGVSGYAVSFAVMAFAPNVVILIVARALAGILSSATLPTAMAYIADTTEAKDRSRGVGLMGAAMGVGMIFGPALGGLLAGANLPLPAWLLGLMQTMVDPDTGRMINLSVPFFFAGLLALVTLPVIHLALPESLHQALRRDQPRPQGSRLSQLGTALKSPLGFLYLMALLLSFALANLEGVLGLYAKDQFSLGPERIGLLMGAMGILSVIQQGFLIGPLTRKFGEERVLQGGLIVSMLGFLGLALLHNVWGMVVFVLIFNVGNVLLQPSVTSLISQRTLPEQQGAAMGSNNAFQSLGRAVGPLWAGFAYDLTPTLSFWTGALFQLIAFVYALRMLGPIWGPKLAHLPAAVDPIVLPVKGE